MSYWIYYKDYGYGGMFDPVSYYLEECKTVEIYEAKKSKIEHDPSQEIIRVIKGDEVKL